MTMQGIGAALSPALGGFVAEQLGYASAFLVLGAVALVALVLWVVTRPMTAQYGGTPGLTPIARGARAMGSCVTEQPRWRP